MRWLLLFISISAQAGIPELIEKVAPSVVFVSHPMQSGSGLSIGDGYILTAAHVIAPPVMAVIDDNDKAYPAAVLGIDKNTDIALLRIAEKIPFTPLIEGDCRLGVEVVYYGSPLAVRHTAFVGRIANTRGTHLAVAVVVASGSSGGPVFDTEGRLCGILVGMAVSRVNGSQIAGGIAYVVRVADIRRSVAAIKGVIESPSGRNW